MSKISPVALQGYSYFSGWKPRVSVVLFEPGTSEKDIWDSFPWGLPELVSPWAVKIGYARQCTPLEMEVAN